VSFQFARDLYVWVYYRISFIYVWGPTKWLIATADRILPFELSQPVFMIKLLLSIVHLLAMVGMVHFWFLDKRVTKTAAWMILGWFGFGLILNFLGRVLHDESILYNARTLTDYLLQPFGIAFIIPAMILYKRQIPKQEIAAQKQVKPLESDEIEVDD
jgi:hypothetical protein